MDEFEVAAIVRRLMREELYEYLVQGSVLPVAVKGEESSSVLVSSSLTTSWAAQGTGGGLDADTLDGLHAADIIAGAPAAHASSHERGGSDEIDGDHLDIDFTPTTYTPSTTPAEAANVDDLAAHLYGIDVVLGSHATSISQIATNTSNISTNTTSIANHIADTSDAHDASAISVLDTAAQYAATDVESALAEVMDATQANAANLTSHQSSSDHDGRYYTEAEIDSLLSGKSDTGHVHAASTVTIADATSQFVGTNVEAALDEAMDAAQAAQATADSKTDDTAAIAAQNDINSHLADTSDAHDASAISILDTAALYAATDVEAALAEVMTDTNTNAQDLSSHAGSSDHDGRYYTEAEVDAIAATKASTSHNHSLVNLSDVNISGQSDGDRIVWDSTLGEWIAAPTGSPSSHGSSHEYLGSDQISCSMLTEGGLVTPSYYTATNKLGGGYSVNQMHAHLEGIDDALGARLLLAGGTMSGAIAMGSNKITGLAAGTASTDAIRLSQLNAHINDTTDAHDASAISVADSGGLLAATEVESALAEVAAAINVKACSISGSGTLPSNANTPRPFSTADIDIGGMADTTNNRIDLEAGKTYLVGGKHQCSSGGTYTDSVYLYLDGTEIARTSGAGGSSIAASCSAVAMITVGGAANGYLTLSARHDQGTSQSDSHYLWALELPV